jgi:TetR/AcrR family transcriptional regulator, lmrAB and yxaGH operons repressor
MIDTAIRLFQRQGYHATGLAQILTESGAPKGSFYHHFPNGKEELAEFAIRKAGKSITDIIAKNFAAGIDFEDGIRKFSSGVANWFAQSDYSAGCPISSTLLETVPQSSRMQTTCEAVMLDWINEISGHAVRHGYKRDAQMLARSLVMSVEGAWILARATRSTHPFEIASLLVIGLLPNSPNDLGTQ